jgi:hypothetical protein
MIDAAREFFSFLDRGRLSPMRPVFYHADSATHRTRACEGVVRPSCLKGVEVKDVD